MSDPQPTPPTPDMYQVVRIQFTDGTEGKFAGPAVVMKDKQKSIVGIWFTEPRPLPPGCSFGKIDG